VQSPKTPAEPSHPAPAPESTAEGLADRIGRLLDDANALARFARHRDLAWALENPLEAKSGPAISERQATRLRREIAAYGEPLARDVRRAGLNPRAIRTVVHIAEPDGDGPQELMRRWEDLRLRLTDLRDEASEGPRVRGRDDQTDTPVSKASGRASARVTASSLPRHDADFRLRVAAARARGDTWEKIGEDFGGVSRQAAQKWGAWPEVQRAEMIRPKRRGKRLRRPQALGDRAGAVKDPRSEDPRERRRSSEED